MTRWSAENEALPSFPPGVPAARTGLNLRENDGREAARDWPSICVGCKETHVEDAWLPLASYLKERLGTDVTVAVCPACAELRSIHGCALLGETPLPQPPNLMICADCKRILDASGTWLHVEDHLRDNMHLRVIHTVCPRCTAWSARK